MKNMNLNKPSLRKKFEEAEEFLLKQENAKAIELLEQLLDEIPTNERLWLLMGIANRRIGNKKKALQYFKTATELDSSMVEAWGLLTITYIDLNKIDEAQKSINNAAELNPSNEKLRFYSQNLIKIYLEFGPFFETLESSDKNS
jgi:tetratricopeptide (TPR) repeat protein